MNALFEMFGIGSGLAGQAADDIGLRQKWLKLKEQEALGEIPALPDYKKWKKSYLLDQTRNSYE